MKQVYYRTDGVTVCKMASTSRPLPPNRDEEVAKCLSELNTVNLRASEESELHNVVLDYFVSPVIGDDDSETDLDSQTRSETETESDSISEPGSEPHSSTKRPRMESSEADETNKQGLCVKQLYFYY